MSVAGGENEPDVLVSVMAHCTGVTAHPTSLAAHPTNVTALGKPEHVSDKLWEKFKALEKRTDEVTKRSTEKRMKHLRNHITSKVEKHLDIDSNTDVTMLTGEDVHSGLTPSKNQPSTDTANSNVTNTIGSGDRSSSQAEQWNAVRKHLCLSHPVEEGTSGGKTRLEQQIDTALNKKDYSRAEVLSDQLANRQFGVKIAHAFDAREFLKRKKEEDDKHKAKKKKLNWGFEHKQRWESKSNM